MSTFIFFLVNNATSYSKESSSSSGVSSSSVDSFDEFTLRAHDLYLLFKTTYNYFVLSAVLHKVIYPVFKTFLSARLFVQLPTAIWSQA